MKKTQYDDLDQDLGPGISKGLFQVQHCKNGQFVDFTGEQITHENAFLVNMEL